MHVFTFPDYAALIGTFASKAPEIMSAHPETAQWALRIHDCRLADVMENRFTLAIVGQMRAGKSTLLNALLGCDVAPTGVTETTATINRFQYASGGRTGHFRVVWQDGTDEDIPLERVGEWVGSGENAVKTRRMDFFVDSAFLKTACIVDTPGLRSVIASHESSTQDFLAEKHHQSTLDAGEHADAILYVVNPVAREADWDELSRYGDRTRIPGASPVNSIAIMQKWERLDGDPIESAKEQCRRLEERLEGKIAVALPCSGLLARATVLLEEDVWACLTDLVRHNRDAVSLLALSDADFLDPDIGTQDSFTARQWIHQQIESRFREAWWPLVRFVLPFALSRGIDSGAKLRQEVHQASNMKTLEEKLHNHFFAHAALIKAGSALNKALKPCEIACGILSNLEREYTDMSRTGMDLLRFGQKTPEWERVAAYIRETGERMNAAGETVRISRNALEELKNDLEENFLALDMDTKCLEILASAKLEGSDRSELMRLFGHGSDASGLCIWRRLGFDSSPDTAVLRQRSLERRMYWQGKQERAVLNDHRMLYEHAVGRLEHILLALRPK